MKKELRIGNFVYCDEGDNVCTISAIREYHCRIDYIRTDTKEPHNSQVELERIIPIPLTEEWLKKFSFEYEFVAVFTLIKGNIELIELKDNLGWGLCSEQFPVQIKWVHQLQNIFYALSSEELKIQNDK